MFIERKQQMRFAVFFIIIGFGPLIMPALPCAGLVPVIYRRELDKHTPGEKNCKSKLNSSKFNFILNAETATKKLDNNRE